MFVLHLNNKNMTAIEAVKEITRQEKYYTHVKPPIPQSTAYRIVVAIKAGTCKPETEREFLSKFGYKVKSEVEYEAS
jgi:hypothetical protein